jgi:serine/threonine-protein kinase HipA
MSVGGKFQGITREDLTVFAERHDVPGALNVLNQINDAVDSWAMFASSAKIPPQVSDTIAKDFQRV